MKVVCRLVWDTHMELVPHSTIQGRLHKEVRSKGNPEGEEEAHATFERRKTEGNFHISL